MATAASVLNRTIPSVREMSTAASVLIYCALVFVLTGCGSSPNPATNKVYKCKGDKYGEDECLVSILSVDEGNYEKAFESIKEDYPGILDETAAPFPDHSQKPECPSESDDSYRESDCNEVLGWVDVRAKLFATQKMKQPVVEKIVKKMQEDVFDVLATFPSNKVDDHKDKFSSISDYMKKLSNLGHAKYSTPVTVPDTVDWSPFVAEKVTDCKKLELVHKLLASYVFIGYDGCDKELKHMCKTEKQEIAALFQRVTDAGSFDAQKTEMMKYIQEQRVDVFKTEVNNLNVQPASEKPAEFLAYKLDLTLKNVPKVDTVGDGDFYFKLTLSNGPGETVDFTEKILVDASVKGDAEWKDYAIYLPEDFSPTTYEIEFFDKDTVGRDDLVGHSKDQVFHADKKLEDIAVDGMPDKFVDSLKDAQGNYEPTTYAVLFNKQENLKTKGVTAKLTKPEKGETYVFKLFTKKTKQTNPLRYTSPTFKATNDETLDLKVNAKIPDEFGDVFFFQFFKTSKGEKKIGSEIDIALTDGKFSKTEKEVTVDIGEEVVSGTTFFDAVKSKTQYAAFFKLGEKGICVGFVLGFVLLVSVGRFCSVTRVVQADCEIDLSSKLHLNP